MIVKLRDLSPNYDSGQIKLDSLERICEPVIAVNECIARVEVSQFEPFKLIKIHFDAKVEYVCQSCLEIDIANVARSFELAIIGSGFSEEQIDEIMQTYDCTDCVDDELNIKSLIEDELLISPVTQHQQKSLCADKLSDYLDTSVPVSPSNKAWLEGLEQLTVN